MKPSTSALTFFLLYLGSCNAYREAWRRDGACAVVCDYRTGYMSAARPEGPYACRCITPEHAEINRQRMVPIIEEAGTVYCYDGCAAEARRIIARQPWRAAAAPEFDDPLAEMRRDWQAP